MIDSSAVSVASDAQREVGFAAIGKGSTMETPLGSTNLGGSVDDGHVAWFWRQVTRGGEGLSAAELAEHVTVDARGPQLGFSSPEAFSTSVQTGVFAGATLGEVSVDEQGRIVAGFVTSGGLRLHAVFIGEMAAAGRIKAVGLRIEGGASVTAVSMAGYRAAHWLLDEPKILADTLAEALAGEFAAESIARVRADPTDLAIRYTLAARSRLAEETVFDARSAADQYVLLGAGLDSFAYRRSDPGDGLRVFEVDQPASQSWKRQRLADIGVAIPGSVTFVPVDFERQDLDVELSKAGFDSARASVVAWLGVTYYLSSEAIADTLTRIAGWAAGTRLLFDYQIPERLSDSVPGRDWDRRRAVAAQMAASGEPWVSFFSPEDIEALLRAHGYDSIEDYDHNALRSVYMGGHGAGPGPLPELRIVRATVTGRPRS
jgi:methyltransferase (TIGR00027 family)